MKILSAIFCMAILAGCSNVTMKEPFPESQLRKEEQGQLTGTWRLENSVAQVAFTSNGVPWLASVEWKDDGFVLYNSRLHFTRHNDSLYVCMPTEPGQTNEYFFAEFNLNDKTAVVWVPDVDVFEELIGNGSLEGSVEKDKHSKSISLDSNAAEILKFVSTHRAAFDYKNPLLFQKLD